MRSDETNLQHNTSCRVDYYCTVWGGKGGLKGQRQQKQTEQELEEYHKYLTRHQQVYHILKCVNAFCLSHSCVRLRLLCFLSYKPKLEYNHM